MKSFRHTVPPLRIFQGADCLDSLDAELERVGSKRAVIVCADAPATLTLPMTANFDAVMIQYGPRQKQA
jgi:alcohol dehydrogenase class IV